MDGDTIENNFTYHAPTDQQILDYRTIRIEAGCLARTLKELCPQSKELDLSFTNLEQAVFWANASIARNSKP